jgi:hypothetical protein
LAVKALGLLRVDVQAVERRQLVKMLWRRGHHDELSARPQHPRDFGAVAGSEDVERQIDDPVGDRNVLPEVSAHGRDPPVRMCRSPRCGGRCIQGDAAGIWQRSERSSQVVARPAAEAEDDG